MIKLNAWTLGIAIALLLLPGFNGIALLLLAFSLGTGAATVYHLTGGKDLKQLR